VRTDKQPGRRRWLLLAATAGLLSAFAVVAGELLFRAALEPADFLVVDLEIDPVLGLKIKPNGQGHDANGFRNKEAPAKSDIVAIGDSMTYGYNATREESWPGHLARITGRDVYNTGVGGFGPLQHWHVSSHIAAPLKPRLQIVAIYLGNDLMEGYGLAQANPYWHSWRRTIRAPDALSDFDREGRQEWSRNESRRFMGPARDWLAANSMLYGVLRVAVLSPLSAALSSRESAPLPPEDNMPWADPAHPEIRTVFASRVRLLALDPDIPEVSEGLSITHQSMQQIRQSTAERGEDLLYIIIPTKEHAFCAALHAAGAALPATHAALCRVEPKVVAGLVNEANRLGIPVADMTPALSAAIQRGQKVYPESSDGHPIGSGYEVIATEVARRIADGRVP
jgi:hypothetical protein